MYGEVVSTKLITHKRCLFFTRCFVTKNVTKEVAEFVQSNYPSLFERIPNKYFKRIYRPTTQFILDDDVARKSVDTIKPFLTRNKSCVLELNPGLGVLTRHLLPIISRLLLIEEEKEFVPFLKELENKQECNVSVFEASLPSSLVVKSKDKSFLESIPFKPWDDDIAFKIISTAHWKLIWFLIRSVMLQEGLLTQGRPELYLFVSPSLYKTLSTLENGAQKYKTVAVLFQLLFDQEMLLDNIPPTSFLPWDNFSKRKGSDHTKNSMVLIRVIGKADLFRRVPNLQTLEGAYHFIKTAMAYRKRRVIPTLESIVPKCGPRLIFKGYTMYCQFDDLTPNELLDLFINFSQWPEYESTFKAALHNIFTSEKKKTVIEKGNASDQNTPTADNENKFVSTNDEDLEHENEDYDDETIVEEDLFIRDEYDTDEDHDKISTN